MRPDFQKIKKDWWWLLSPKLLTQFEADRIAQGYEILRRCPKFQGLLSRLPRPPLRKDVLLGAILSQFEPERIDLGVKMLHQSQKGRELLSRLSRLLQTPSRNEALLEINPFPAFHKRIWRNLYKYQRINFLMQFGTALSQIGLIKTPLIAGPKGISFDCTLPATYLIAALESSIRSSVDAVKNRRCLLPAIMIGAMPTKPAISVGFIKFPERPDDACGVDYTRRLTEWEVEDPIHCPELIHLLLPLVFHDCQGRNHYFYKALPKRDHQCENCPVGISETPLSVTEPGRSEESPRCRERYLYAEEIIACFRTFIKKPPKDFIKHRRRILRQSKPQRALQAHTITVGLMAYDYGAPLEELGKWMKKTQTECWPKEKPSDQRRGKIFFNCTFKQILKALHNARASIISLFDKLL